MGVEYEHWILPKRRDYVPSTQVVARFVELLRSKRWVLTPGMARFAELRGGYGTPPDVRGEDDTGAYASLFGTNPHTPKRGRPVYQPVPAPLDASWLDARMDERHPSPLAREIGLCFPIQIPDEELSTWEEAGLEYPFTFGEDDVFNYHQITLYVADDFVTHDWTNTFQSPIDDSCQCGTKLRYDPDRDYPAYVAAHSIDGRIRRVCPTCKAPFDPTGRASVMNDGWEEGRSAPLPGGITFRFAVRIDCHKGWPREHGRISLKPELRELIEEVIGEPCEDFGGLY